MERVILHSDLNNFYASVECLYHPGIRNHPVAVGGDTEKRHGIVLAKNYLAKKYGVQTGEALWQARQKCPNLIFVEPHYNQYIKFSKLAKRIYGEYTDQIESFGMDECWLDVTGSLGLFESGAKIADEIRKKMFDRLGVTASVGVSYNKVFAKMGSNLKKPDATTIITKENYQKILWSLPVSELFYVGRATLKKLNRVLIYTIGDLAKTDVKRLEQMLGIFGHTLWTFANGYDRSPVSKHNEKPYIKTIGNSTTTPRDLTTDEDVRITLYVLCESVAARLREHNFQSQTVQITIRDNKLFSYQRQGALPFPTMSAQNLFNKAFALYKKNHVQGTPIRSIGVRACKLTCGGEEQISFLPEVIKQQREEHLERVIDDIRYRFGHHLIKRGLLLKDRQLSDLNPKEEHIIHPDSFFR